MLSNLKVLILLLCKFKSIQKAMGKIVAVPCVLLVVSSCLSKYFTKYNLIHGFSACLSSPPNLVIFQGGHVIRSPRLFRL